MKVLYSRNGNDDVIELHDKVPKMDEIIREKVSLPEEAERDDAFFLVDLGEIYRKLEAWRLLLPRVQPFYALKCNHDPETARFLANAGVGFDCASKKELEQILELGVHPSRIVYANPCKQNTHIKFAAQKKVDLMTFDGVHELIKIKKHFPVARLLLRIQSSREHSAKHDFNKKFGCNPEHARDLLFQAKKMGLQIVGVSFHVGSLPEEVACFASSISEAHDVFQIGEELGFDMRILDIGGGFPGVDDHDMNFEKVAEVVNAALEKYFPMSSGVRIMAEPGRYLVSSAFTLAVNVIAKRVVKKESTDEDTKNLPSLSSPAYNVNDDLTNDDSGVDVTGDNSFFSDDGLEEESAVFMYYVNDGIYGAFNNVFTDHAVIWPILLTDTESEGKDSRPVRERLSLIWGPTCDGLDCVMKECRLPEMDIGQWLYFYNMGAYTVSLSCDFNGIPRPLRFYVCAKQYWNKLYPVTPKLSEATSTTMGADYSTSLTGGIKGASDISSTTPGENTLNFDRQRKRSYRLELFKGE